jgi:hypothetical protein
MDLYNAIESRISIRKYEDKTLHEDVINIIKEKLNNINPMYDDIKVRLELLEGDSLGMGFFHGFAKIVAPYCIVAISENKKGYLENIGFIEEQVVLALTDIGIGTCWLGTFNDKKIREVLNLNDSEKITNVISVGYPFKEKNFRNSVFRNFVGRSRKQDTEIAYYMQWKKTACEYLNKKQSIKKILHMSILAPSGGNKQPVYVVFTEDSVSFFVENKRNELIINRWAEMDAGIFISHFYLCCIKENIKISFYKEKSPMKKYNVSPEFSYIISLNILL